MYAKWRLSTAIDLRMDATFYEPRFMKIESSIRNAPYPSVRLGTLLKKVFKGAFYILAEEYIDTGEYPFIRVADITGGYVDLTKATALSPKTHQRERKTAVFPGYILFAKGGSIGNSAVVPNSIQEANISQDVIGAIPSEELDPYYAQAFLSSSAGIAQMVRWVQGNVHPHLTNEAIKNIYILFPNEEIQKAIGNKVRKAERLRELAQDNIKRAKENFEDALKWSNKLNTRHLAARVNPDKLQSRLDLNFNSPNRYLLIEHLEKHRIKLDLLSELTKITAMIGWKGLTTEYYTDSGPWLLRGVEFDNGIIDFDSLVQIERHKYDEQPQIHLEKGDVAMTKDGSIGKAIVIPEISNQMASGSTVARIRIIDQNEISPHYLEFALNHPVLQIQIQSFSTGMAQPHITQEWIAQLTIPRCVREDEIETLISKHHEAQTLSIELINKAKKEIESLIDGSLNTKKLLSDSHEIEQWLAANPSPYAQERNNA